MVFCERAATNGKFSMSNPGIFMNPLQLTLVGTLPAVFCRQSPVCLSIIKNPGYHIATKILLFANSTAWYNESGNLIMLLT
jgi:hypothetical protein